MKKLCVILLVILTVSCIRNAKEKDSQIVTDGQVNLEMEKKDSKVGVAEESVLIEKRVMHEFSEIDKKDEFYVCIKGESIVEGKVVFKIISHNGTEIFNEEFPSSLLLDYGFKFEGDPNSIEDKENYIKDRIGNFFNENSFNNRPIEPDEDFDAEFSNKEIWDDIKSDSTAIGFTFFIGETGSRSIAFSKKTGKVVMYFSWGSGVKE